jgi:hypothetical protein
MFLAESSTLQWIGVLAPLLAVLIGGLGVYAAWRPFINERRQREEELRVSAERLENAAALLFGVDGDQKRGILPIKGLVERMDKVEHRAEFLEKVMGVNGTRPARSILQMLEDANRERTELKRTLEDLRRWLEERGGRP